RMPRGVVLTLCADADADGAGFGTGLPALWRLPLPLPVLSGSASAFFPGAAETDEIIENEKKADNRSFARVDDRTDMVSGSPRAEIWPSLRKRGNF
ncbi:MAG: hypothetical protein ABF854_18850, partial [Gluconacetobacter sp.]